ncbi:hypothetical protein E3J79_01575 [Candidatus Dependentiae bacterium]|nr:MAG: hypothetical protein E3J79_01575 [Candidatus Dependentiae bacterium]
MNPKKNLLTGSSIPLKLLSLFFGFSFWYIFIQEYHDYQQVMVPISFYNISSDVIISAPEMATITVHGKRIDIHTLDTSTLAFHFNAQLLKKGKNSIPLLADQLFLPDHVSLLNCSPSTILVYVDKTSEQEHS